MKQNMKKTLLLIGILSITACSHKKDDPNKKDKKVPPITQSEPRNETPPEANVPEMNQPTENVRAVNQPTENVRTVNQPTENVRTVNQPTENAPEVTPNVNGFPPEFKDIFNELTLFHRTKVQQEDVERWEFEYFDVWSTFFKKRANIEDKEEKRQQWEKFSDLFEVIEYDSENACTTDAPKKVYLKILG